MLTDTALTQALASMDRLLKHPITFTFHEIACAEASPAPGSTPPGLLAVRDRLREGHYKTISEWAADVEAVVHSYESASDNPFECIAANAVRQCFRKERARMAATTGAFWALSLAELRARLSQLSGAVPARLRASMLPIAPVERPKPQALELTGHEIEEALLHLEAMPGSRVGGLVAAIGRLGGQECAAPSSVGPDNTPAICAYLAACTRKND
jgi:hypothetical protein